MFMNLKVIPALLVTLLSIIPNSAVGKSHTHSLNFVERTADRRIVADCDSVPGEAVYPPRIKYSPLDNRQVVNTQKASTIDGWRLNIQGEKETYADVRWAWVDDGHIRFHLRPRNEGLYGGKGPVSAQLALFNGDITADPYMVFTVTADLGTMPEKCVVVDKELRNYIMTLQMFEA